LILDGKGVTVSLWIPFPACFLTIGCVALLAPTALLLELPVTFQSRYLESTIYCFFQHLPKHAPLIFV